MTGKHRHALHESIRRRDIEGEHAAARDRGLRRSLGAAAIYRLVSGVSPFLVVPIALSQLGRTTYGIWMTAAGLTAFLTFADLGLGNALMTRLGGLRASGDERTIRSTLGITYRLLVTVSVSAVGLVVLLWQVTPWEAWFGLGAPADGTRAIVLICLLTFALNVPAALIMRVQFGLQETGSSYLWQCAGPLLSVVGAYLCWWLSTPDAVFVLAAVTGPLVGNLACTVWWFSRHPALRPTWTGTTRGEALSIVGMGGRFLVLTLIISVTMNLDVLLIPRYLGVEDVTDFSVPWRVMSQLGLVAALASLPMWPASAQALARGELDWVSRRVRKMMVVNLALIGPPCVVLCAFGPQLLHLWLGDAVQADRTLIAGFSVWWCLVALVTPFIMVQNAAGTVGPQICGWGALLATVLVAKVAYLDLAGSIRLLPWISVAAYALTVLPAACIGYRTTMRRHVGEPVTTSVVPARRVDGQRENCS